MRENEVTSGGISYVHYLDYGDGFTNAYLCLVYQIVLFKYVHYVYQLYHSKAVYKINKEVVTD